MATSLPMAANDHHHHQQQPPRNPNLPQQDHDQRHHPVRRSAGRRKPKSGGDSAARPKKRGMGVEKLERLRLQEGLKKMIEINPSNLPDLINAAHVPVQMPLNVNRNRSPNPQLGFHHGQMGHVADHHLLQMDLSGNGCLSHSGYVGRNVNGISRELSSSPNVVKPYVCEQYCHACHKKKKLVNGENMGGGGRRMTRESDMYAQMYNVGECGFVGLDVGDNRSIIKQENQGLGISDVGYSLGIGKQGMEVVEALHRKLGGTFGSEEGNDHVLMEYEFFPPSSRIDDDDDLVMMNNTQKTSSEMAGFDAVAAAASNKCIDLSLKLSYNY